MTKDRYKQGCFNLSKCRLILYAMYVLIRIMLMLGTLINGLLIWRYVAADCDQNLDKANYCRESRA